MVSCSSGTISDLLTLLPLSLQIPFLFQFGLSLPS